MFKYLQITIIALIVTACGEGRMSPQGGTITGATVGGGLLNTSSRLGLLTSCANGELLKWDTSLTPDAWVCAVDAGLSGLTTNTIPKATSATAIGNSLLTDNGTILSYNGGWFTVDSADGDTSVYGQLYADGQSTLDSIFGRRNVGAGSTVDVKSAIYGETYGTYNTTAGIIYAYAFRGRADGTRSAGANDLENNGGYFSATGGQTNIGTSGTAFSAAGTNNYGGYFSASSGTNNWAIYGALGNVKFEGGTTLGDNSADAHSITGTLNANGTPSTTNGQILTVVAGLPQWAAPATSGGVTGTGTANTMTKWTSTTAVGNSSVTDTGALVTVTNPLTVTGTFDVNGALSKFGVTDGETYINGGTLNFQHANDSDQPGYINYFGYNNASTRFRDLDIRDGKGAQVALFTGSTKAVSLAGALSVTGLVTATVGVTTPANLTTTGTGDLVVADDASFGAIGTSTSTVSFSGTDAASYFNFSATEDTYIRGGKTSSVVFVGDANTGNVMIGAAGNPTYVSGTLGVTGLSTLTGGFNSSAGPATVGDFRGTVQSVATCAGHNVTLDATTTVLRCAAGSVYGITGGVNGRVIYLVAAGLIDIANEASGSTAANRLTLTSSSTSIVNAGAIIPLIYDSTSSRWLSTDRLRYGQLYSETTVDAVGALTVGGDTILGNATTDIQSLWGKQYHYGTAPTLSGCASCTMRSDATDAAGTITCTDGPNACTVTFSAAFDTNAPSCTVSVSGQSGAVRDVWMASPPTTSVMTVSTSGTGTHSITYQCPGTK